MANPTGGVKPMTIAGRMVRERERLAGMTHEERAWRKMWLKDQILCDEPPIPNKALDKEFLNPIRRLYRFPLDKLCDALTPSLGFQKAYAIRFYTGKFAMIIAGIYLGAYYFEYNQNSWIKKSGWRVLSSRRACNPGDEGFPKLSDRTLPSDYAARGFKDSPI